MVILYLILPLVFYSLGTGVIALILPLQAVTCTLLGAVVTFPVLCYWPYRSDQARRGVIPPIPFRFRGCLPVIILLGIGTCISVNNIILGKVSRCSRQVKKFNNTCSLFYLTFTVCKSLIILLLIRKTIIRSTNVDSFLK